MATKGKIDELYDVEKMEGQQEKVIAFVKEFIGLVNEAKPIAIKVEGAEKTKDIVDGIKAINTQTEKIVTTAGNASKQYADLIDNAHKASSAFADQKSILDKYGNTLEDNIRRQLQYKNRLDEIKDSIKSLGEFKGISGDGAQQVQEELERLTKEQFELKQASSDATSTIRAQVKEAQAASGSYDQLNARLQLLNKLYEKLGDDGQQTGFGKDLLKDINEIDAKLKDMDLDRGIGKRFVGLYSQQLSPLFETLTAQIEKLKTEQQSLQDLSQRNPIGFQRAGGDDRLNQVTASIVQLDKAQKIGFQTNSTYTAQVRQLETALDDMSKSGNQDIQFLDQFRSQLKSVFNQNYSGSFKGAFQFLEQELQAVKQSLKDPALKGQQLQQLQKQEQILTQITDNLRQGFSSTRQEARAFQEAAKQLGISIGTTDETFIGFTERVGEAKNELDDIQKTLQFQSGDVKFLTGAINGVNALVSAYGSLTAAEGLLGNDNEDLQKTMVKFQQLLVLTNGIQQIANSLQTESGVIQLALAAKTQIVNAAKAVEAKFFAQSAAAIQAENIAIAENATALQATAVAQGEAAATTDVAATAMEGEAVAATAATTATSALRTALISTGIGAIIVGLAAGVAWLVGKISDWNNADEKAIKLQDDLAEATKKVNDAVNIQIGILGEKNKDAINKLKDQLQIEQAFGANQYKLFAIKSKIAQLENDQAKSALTEAQNRALDEQREVDQSNQRILRANKIFGLQSRLKDGTINFIQYQKELNKIQSETVTNSLTGEQALAESRKRHFADYQVANNKYIEIEKALTSNNKTIDRKKLQEDADRLAKRRDDAKAYVDYIDNITKTSADTQNGIEENKTEEAKFSADERRRIALESALIEVDISKTKNQRILNDDRTTLAQKQSALAGILEAEKKAALAQFTDVKNNPSSTDADILIATKKKNADIEKANIAYNESMLKLNESYRLRDLAAQKSIFEVEIQRQVDTNKELLNDTNLSLTQRLSAYQSYVQNRKVQVDAEYEYELKQAGLSAESIKKFRADSTYDPTIDKTLNPNGVKLTYDELLAYAKEYENNVLQLGIDANRAMTSVISSELAKQADLRHKNIEEIKRFYDQLDVDNANKYAEDLTALNNNLIAKKISLHKYLIEREKLEAKFEIQSQVNTINSLQAQINAFGDAAKEALDAKQKVADLEGQLKNATTDGDKKSISDKLTVAKQEYAIAEKRAEDEIQLEKDKQKAIKKIQDDAVNSYIDAKKKLNDLEKQLAGELLDILQEVVDNGYDKQNKAIQDQIDLINIRAERELDAINQSSDSEKQKAEKTKILQLKQADQTDRLQRKQKENDVKKAKFDKAVSVAKIAGTGIESVAALTAQAAIAQARAVELAAQSLANPLLIPAAAAMQGAVAAIGAEIPISIALSAAQIAAVLAQPIPTYAEGTDDHPGSLAIVGDANKHELVELPSGQQFITPDRPTLVDLPKHTKVYPDAEELLMKIFSNQAARDEAVYVTQSAISYLPQIDRLESTIDSGLKRLEKTISNKQETHILIENPLRSWVRNGGGTTQFNQ